jgi:hypothetical protein
MIHVSTFEISNNSLYKNMNTLIIFFEWYQQKIESTLQ